jgi:hypothetical protein
VATLRCAPFRLRAALLPGVRAGGAAAGQEARGGAGDPRPAGRRVERARARLHSDWVNLLRRIAEVPPSITDGAFSPHGHAFVLCDYSAAHLVAAPSRQVDA